MRPSVVVLAVIALFTYVCAQKKDVSEFSLKRYMHLRKWVQRAIKYDRFTSGKIQTWRGRTSCLKDDEQMLPQRLLDWFHVLKSIDLRKSGKRDTNYETVPGCTSPAIIWFFREFDKNKDLLLDQNELAELETIPYEHCMRKLFDKCDLNKDHKLSLQETCSCFSIDPPCSANLKKYNAEGALLGTYRPDCDEDGYYKPRQCYKQYCWCVDRFNQVVEGTKDIAWLVKNCRDNTDPNEVIFAGDEQDAE